MLVSILEKTPGLLDEGSLVARPQVVRARELSILILTGTGQARRTPKEIAMAAELRVRAFTLVIRTYAALRRAALYVRWERGEGDKLVPSLFSGHGGRRRSKARRGNNAEERALSAPDDEQRALSAPHDEQRAVLALEAAAAEGEEMAQPWEGVPPNRSVG